MIRDDRFATTKETFVEAKIKPGKSEEYMAQPLRDMLLLHPHVADARIVGPGERAEPFAWSYEMRGEASEKWIETVAFDHPREQFHGVGVGGDLEFRKVTPLYAGRPPSDSRQTHDHSGREPEDTAAAEQVLEDALGDGAQDGAEGE